MKNEWKNIDETTRNRLEEALDQREMNSKPYSQEWFEDGQIDEVAFCENFLQRIPLKCINGIFFSYDGMLPDSEVEKEIYRMVEDNTLLKLIYDGNPIMKLATGVKY